MSVSLRILPEHFLVYIHCVGRMDMSECARTFAAMIAHPDYRKGMRELVDFSDLTDWERDYPAMMRHQAREAEVRNDPRHPSLVVCLAPDDRSQGLAQFIKRAWDHTHHVVAVTVETEPEALAVLGVDVPSIAALLQTT